LPEFSRLEVRPAELPCARKGAKKMLGLFPTNSCNNSNYYVDVAFKPQLAA
jgi:hypothetical protein